MQRSKSRLGAQLIALGWLLLQPAAAYADFACPLPQAAEPSVASETPLIVPPVVDCAIAPLLHARRITRLSVQGVPDQVAALVCDALHPPNTLDQPKANDLCNNAMALRIFERVQLTAEPHGDAVALQLGLTVAPRITAVTLDATSDRDPVLTPLLETHGAHWAADRIESLRNAAQDVLVGDGFVAATLAVTSTRTAAGIALQLKLTRGARANLARIVVVGNHVISQREVERLLALDNPGFNRIGGIPSLAMVHRYFAPRLQRYYHNRGYLELRVVDASLLPSRQGSAVALVLRIADGRRYTLGAVVDESRQPHPATLAIRLPLGSVVNEAYYAHVIGEFSRTAARAGFSAYVDFDTRSDLRQVTLRFRLKRRVEPTP
jgi:outer membrane protein assembly factor BamA